MLEVLNTEFRLILAFGSNLGNLEQNLLTALDFFNQSDPSFMLLKQSKLYLTAPFPNSAYSTQYQDDYLNFVCDIQTNESPFDFYKNFIVPIEDQLGHSRDAKWKPRCLDVDILFSAFNTHDDFKKCTPIIVQNSGFCIPHKGVLNLERVVIKNLLKNELNLDDECFKCHFNLVYQNEKK